MSLLKKQIILLILLTFYSCGVQEVKTTKELNRIFSKTEIQDLNKLVDFFEQRINPLNSDLDTEYQKWINRIINLDDTVWNSFNFNDQLNVYKELDFNTFNEIWEFNQLKRIPDRDTLRYLTLAYDKKYHKYLTELGKNSIKMKWYSSKTDEDGDIPQVFDLQTLFVTVDSVNGSYKVQSSYDFNERLIITISSLKSFDNYTRKENWNKK